mmetsp:Transcript_21816/g.34198  ORF Transcript_21816/g.34198 Transcript_21816/m.34198 type:complete len:281 (-) Transcript_21816:193-1035(-)
MKILNLSTLRHLALSCGVPFATIYRSRCALQTLSLLGLRIRVNATVLHSNRIHEGLMLQAGLLVVLVGSCELLDVSGGQHLNELCRAPAPQLAGRHSSAWREKRAGANNSTSLNQGTLTHQGTCSNDCPILHCASPEDTPSPNRDIIPNLRSSGEPFDPASCTLHVHRDISGFAICRDNTILVDSGPAPNSYGVLIATHNGSVHDAGAITNLDRPNESAVWRNESLARNDGFTACKRHFCPVPCKGGTKLDRGLLDIQVNHRSVGSKELDRVLIVFLMLN